MRVDCQIGKSHMHPGHTAGFAATLNPTTLQQMDHQNVNRGNFQQDWQHEKVRASLFDRQQGFYNPALLWR